jgi:hypothetical protein
MENLADLLSKRNKHQLIWIVLLVLYILFDVKTPVGLADFVDSNVGMLILLFLAGMGFYYFTPVVGVLILVALYELLKRSTELTGSSALKKFVPSEFNKHNQMKAMNNNGPTLEEEVVNNMAPLVKHAGAPNADYKANSNDELQGAPIS